jgi:hypothetical protein
MIDIWKNGYTMSLSVPSSKLRLKILTQTSSPLTREYLKVLGPLLYLFYTADLPTSPESTIATFADDNAILVSDPDPAIASDKLQTSLLAFQHWLTKWKLKANSFKSTHVPFTTRSGVPGSTSTTSNFPKQ